MITTAALMSGSIVLTLALTPATAEAAFAGNQPWTGGHFYGDIGTYLADVNGDGNADGIASNGGTGLLVRLSNGINGFQTA